MGEKEFNKISPETNYQRRTEVGALAGDEQQGAALRRDVLCGVLQI